METIAEDYAVLASPRDVQDARSSTTDVEDDAASLEAGSSNTQRLPALNGGGAATATTAADNNRSSGCTLLGCGKPNKAVEKYLPIVMSVSIGAYVGVGVRVLLTEFADALPASETNLLELLGFSYFLPNAVGCFVMGLAGRWKPVLRGQYDVLLTGITTGFCGCCTTFASWDLGVAMMFVRGKWLNALLVLAVQVAGAFVSFRLGYHVGEGLIHYGTIHGYPFRKPPVHLAQLNVDLERYLNAFHDIKMNSFGQLVARRVHATEESLAVSHESCVELLSEIAQVEQEQFTVRHNGFMWMTHAVLFTMLFWVLAFVGFDNYPSSRLLAVCFGPFGALLRYYLSLKNSQPQWKHFPFYTFLPNVVASILLCAMEIVGSATYAHSADAYRTYVLIGQGAIQVGFLGSLSTVSTWVNELDGLSSRRIAWAYRYGILSIVVSQLASVFMLGIYDVHGNAPLI